MNYYVVEQRRLWGDYGDVLISGVAERHDPDGPLLIQRTAPFLPPISFPYCSTEGSRVVVSTEFKDLLEAKNGHELQFNKTTFTKLVNVNWHLWNLDSPHPAIFPVNDDPINYIKETKHDSTHVDLMSEAWEFCQPISVFRLTRLKARDGSYLDTFSSESNDLINYPDMFLNRSTYGDFIVSLDMKTWLESVVGEWLVFRDIIGWGGGGNPGGNPAE